MLKRKVSTETNGTSSDVVVPLMEFQRRGVKNRSDEIYTEILAVMGVSFTYGNRGCKQGDGCLVGYLRLLGVAPSDIGTKSFHDLDSLLVIHNSPA